MEMSAHDICGRLCMRQVGDRRVGVGAAGSRPQRDCQSGGRGGAWLSGVSCKLPLRGLVAVLEVWACRYQ